MNNGPENESSGLGGEEQALRRLLHGAVEDLEPSDGTLDHLLKAVPRRRARKRQALVGAAAAVLLFGTAIPAFVHVAGAGGTAQDHAVNAGHGQQAQGGAGGDTSTGGAAGQKNGKPSGTMTGDEGDPGKTKESGGSESADPEGGGAGGALGGALGGAFGGTPGGVLGGASSSTNPFSASSPVCDPGQLGITAAEAGEPDGAGRVYGTFRVANVSGSDCAVTGAGSIGFEAMGAADPGRIQVVEHVSGDPASGLPDPSQEAAALLLAPNTSYEVRFAWVPSDTCPASEPTPSQTPAPSGDDSSESSDESGGSGSVPDAKTEAGSGAETANLEPQLLTEDAAEDGSVSVSHTPEPGASSASATIPNACAGTIYRTGVLSTP
ncbi:hypothetical protein [Streptomyces sp. NPDC088725]|uniref:hypothetical protein n=1 Tax=Streptomyces sp. NPDC088725 TaxID=3365873 RepID=UPI0038042F7C